MHTLQSLARTENSLAPHYRDFRVAHRLLLTGHSHQAWPDCAKLGVIDSYDDAAEQADDKWERAFARAERVREAFRRWLGGLSGDITLGQNTHELLVRLLSAFPLRERPRLVTSDGEFHSLRRQLARLAEEGVEVVRIPAEPVVTLAERLAAAQAERASAAVLVSSVLFGTAERVPGLDQLAEACARTGTALVIDAYHHLGVAPFPAGLERAFVVGGGYKYLQLGEGNCFLRTPPDCTLRPVITGWFSEFAELEQVHGEASVAYPRGPLRFAGATYDPVSHYRASAVCDFFVAQGLDSALLGANLERQLERMLKRLRALDLDSCMITPASDTPVEGLGGFLALRSPHTAQLVSALRQRGVLTDARGEILRLGPAPYLSDEQLDTAVDALGECVRSV